MCEHIAVCFFLLDDFKKILLKNMDLYDIINTTKVRGCYDEKKNFCISVRAYDTDEYIHIGVCR